MNLGLPLGDRVHRLIPDGIAARTALTLVLLLILTQAISALVYLTDHPPRRPLYGPASIGPRIAMIVGQIEATPPDRRAQAVEALAEPVFDLAWERSRPDPEGWIELPFRHFRQHLAVDLGDPNRPIIVEMRDDPRRPPPPPPPGPTEMPMALGGEPVHPFGPLRVSVALADGSWVILSRKDPGGPFRLLRFALWMGLSAAAVAGLSLWAGRRLTAPLGRFADAADRLGLDAAAPPLPEDGPRELRAATRAINRMQDRLRRFVEDRTRMLAAIGHDLRTPLTRLRLRAELIDDPEQQRKMLADLDQMQAMIDATLAFARDDAHREVVVAIDLADLLQSLCEERTDAGQSATYEGPPHLTLRCRPVALRRALANLLDNAILYGGGALVRLQSSGSEVVIAIDDNGPGIPGSELEKVFAPFYRLETSRNRDTGGSGLGLAVARTIVRGHGGDVTLVNRAAGGLSATVTLPA